MPIRAMLKLPASHIVLITNIKMNQMKDMLSANVLRYPFFLWLKSACRGNGGHTTVLDQHPLQLPAGKVKQKYLYTGMGHCGGCTYPKASLTQLKTICKFFIWAFTVDDLYEFPPWKKFRP